MTSEQRFERIEAALQLTVELQERAQRNLITLTESVAHYVDAADARMKRIEENLDGLIRAITAEHSNGKPQS
jgi:hypothetical protein